jgi:outer membrane protein OmpA-like peptidoglycan-associated protein
MDDHEQFETDSPATRLLDALGRGDLNALLLEFRPTTIVRTEDQSWSVQGEDEVLFWLEDAFARFPGLVFDSHARHIGYGQVIEEARVRDIGQPPATGDADGQAADTATDAPTDSSAGPGGGELVLDREFGRSEASQLNMPVRLTVLHDDAYVHEIIASYPRALLRAAMGLHVDPLDMALSEIQSAFVAPAGSGFKTYQLGKKRNIETSYAVPEPVPPARIAEPEPEPVERESVSLQDAWTPPPFVPQDPDEDEDDEKPGRRRALLVVPLVVLIVAAIAGGTWWLGRDGDATARPPQQTESTKTTDKPTKKPSSGSPSSSPTKKPTKTATQKPDVVFQSDLAFDINSAELSGAAEDRLDDLAVDIRAAELTGTIEVHGYTDSVGPADYGEELSLRRANAVKDYLQDALDGYRIPIKTFGHGERDPIASNKTEEGRQKNRRVTITLPEN